MFNWYFPSGDLEFFWKEQIRAMSWLPQVFRGDIGYGFNSLLSLWLDYPFRLVLKIFTTLGFSWFVIEKLLWLGVFALAIYSSYKLTKHWLGALVYTTNTYFLLLFAGGQLGVAYAYAFAPFLFYRFMEHEDKRIANGLYIALLVVFDLRVAFLVILATVLWWRKSLIPLLVAGSVHLFWILPTLLASRGTAGLGEQFTNPAMLRFLSFADFSHTISFLHPNWPDNLFGKVYFLQPEFLVIPILAFAAFLVGKKHRYFGILALIGAFFAKGAQEPFGGIFYWMFAHVPGFVMFRDATKFYLYIAIAYSVLISYALGKLNKKVLILIFVLFWVFTLRSFSVRSAQLPDDYVTLKNLLISDTVPSRVLWIPTKEYFGYYSDVHPYLTATSSASLDTSVKYVVVPIDVNKRIFLDDYKYSVKLREKTIAGIQLPRDPRFQNLAVFENPDFAGMQTVIPATAVKQQQLAIIGLVISVLFLLLWMFLR